MLKLHLTFSWYYSTRQLPMGLATVHGMGLLTEMHAMGGHRPNTSFLCHENGSAPRARTNKWTDRRTLPSTLSPGFAVDKAMLS